MYAPSKSYRIGERALAKVCTLVRTLLHVHGQLREKLYSCMRAARYVEKGARAESIMNRTTSVNEGVTIAMTDEDTTC
jgi:hypothetical protein